MSTLYIVGNGFDLHHELRTSFLHFKKYLSENIPSDMERLRECFEVYIDEFDENDWNDFERLLYKCQDALVRNLYEFEEQKYEDDTRAFMSVLYRVKGELLYRWLFNIEKSIVKTPADNNLEINVNDSFFITYNYTSTLECVYKVPEYRVLHIHGDYKKIKSNYYEYFKTRFSDSPDYEDFTLWTTVSDEILLGSKFDDTDIIIDNLEKEREHIGDLLHDLNLVAGKDISDRLDVIEEFIEGKNISNIVILGHQYYGVDEFYYKDLFIPRFKDAQWEIYTYTEDDKKQFEKLKSTNEIKKLVSSEWPDYNKNRWYKA